MPKKFKIKTSELKKLLNVEKQDFPKYSTQILNLANQNAQGTRPKMVGQLSDLIQEFNGASLKEWEEWYLSKHPYAIKNASEKIADMIENFKDVIKKIDTDLIERWVRDLVIIKTFIGLKFQKAILKKIALKLKKDYRLSNPKEESQGIDGFIEKIPISIKPISYKTKQSPPEEIDVKIIYYEKKKDGLIIYFDEIEK